MDLYEALKKLDEAFSIGNGKLAFTSAYDLVNWLEDRGGPIRILEDDNISMFAAGDAYYNIHIDLFREVVDNGLYEFPFEWEDIYGDSSTADNKWELESYREDGIGIYSFVFSPYMLDDDYHADGYDVRFDVTGIGHFYSRNASEFEDTALYEELLKRYHNIELVEL